VALMMIIMIMIVVAVVLLMAVVFSSHGIDWSCGVFEEDHGWAQGAHLKTEMYQIAKREKSWKNRFC